VRSTPAIDAIDLARERHIAKRAALAHILALLPARERKFIALPRDLR
jgi:hypothetical protein